MPTDQPLDLVITLSAAPADAAPDTVALFTLTYGALGPTPPAPLASPLSDAERAELRWYLEEYWQWPYEGFRQRAARVEESLAAIGRRLYAALTSSVAAVRVVDAWRALAERDRRISIVSGLPAALSLPWELLHDEQGFLLLRARHPVSLVRRLPQQEGVPEPAALVLPLRVLLVTARPDDAGFVDPRGIARELLDEVERGDQASGAPPIVVEFLRPPTLPALTERLANTALPPIHILHFDGHGVFAAATPAADGLVLGEAGGRGMLAFETADGLLDLVPADRLAEVLNGSGVRLAMLTACQSAMTGGDDPFSSVAGQLIRGGVDAVVAMSASVLVASAARYVEAFYRKVATGQAVPAAHERARQSLHADPRRHTHRRYADAPGEAVQLRDWWLPHFYQQRALDFQPAAAGTTGKKQVAARGQAASVAPALPAEIAAQVRLPDPPRYGFSGRAAELLRAERWLSAGKLVAVLGFGGVGKTAFAGELAAWLTRTGMYRHALFVTFEGGGDASSLLSTLGHALGVYRSGYDPARLADCIRALRPALARNRTLLIADNLESILDEGEAALPVGERTRLWDALLALRDAGVGVLLTSRSAAFGDARLEPGRGAAQLPLSGLHSEDAYALASNLLRDLDIPAARAPYAALRDLLAALDHHPLSIQLVLPALRDYPLATVQADFAALLPRFADDRASGRNRSLLASLDYSLRRLSAEQRALLLRLAPFEGGASEDDLLAITEIPEAEWATLRPALERAALLSAEKVHDHWAAPFLHFHPVLAPALRAQPGADDPALLARYAERYAAVADYLYFEDDRNPLPVRALVRRELPNLRRALGLLLAQGDGERAAAMETHIVGFLNAFGLGRERAELRRRVALAQPAADSSGELTQASYLRESGLGEDELNSGKLQAAYDRFSALAQRMAALPAAAPRGPESYEYCLTLGMQARCLKAGGRPELAEAQLRTALAVIARLIAAAPDTKGYLRQRGALLCELGDVLSAQGQFGAARTAYEDAEQHAATIHDTRTQGVALGQIGTLALQQRDYAEAARRHAEAGDLFRALGEGEMEAVSWHQLGRVAEEQRQWAEAERCYRTSLEMKERLGDTIGAARTCNQLAIVAENDGRPAEAEGWYQRAIQSAEQLDDAKALAIRLNNLADLLCNEVRAARAPATRLQEARSHAERALAIKETLDASSRIWTTLNILASIAELAGDPTLAHSYRRRERETFAAFAGNRWHIDNQFGDFIQTVAAAASGDAAARKTVEERLPRLEAAGWHVAEAVRRIWAGDRDWHALCADLDRQDALLILRVLETLAGA